MLISCPACGAQISAEAKSCIHCGHPIKKTRSASGLLPFLILLMLLVAGLGAVFQLNPDLRWQDFLPAAADSQQLPTTAIEPPKKLDKSTLQKELQAYAIRLNRLTPYKPNPVLTLQKVYVDNKPASIIFEYELAEGYDESQLRSGMVRKILMGRYCEDEEFVFLKVNGVRVSFRYLRKGRLVHVERISRCELG